MNGVSPGCTFHRTASTQGLTLLNFCKLNLSRSVTQNTPYEHSLPSPNTPKILPKYPVSHKKR